MQRSEQSTRFPSRLADRPSQLFRVRTWLGQERVAFRFRGRRYTFRTAEQAARAQQHLTSQARALDKPIALVSFLIVVLTAAWAISLQPALLLKAVDAARAIVGPGPVAFVESQVFRAGTLLREAQVAFGYDAPRWEVEIAATPDARAPQALVPTVGLLPTPLPTATVAISATATQASVPANRSAATVLRGGNLRSDPTVGENVLGWVLPGDRLEVIDDPLASPGWAKVRVVAPGSAANERPLRPGTVGWISAQLLELGEPPSATASPSAAPSATASPSATIFIPTVTPTPRPLHTPRPTLPPTAVPTIGLVQPSAPPPSAPDTTWALAPIPTAIADGQLPYEGQWQFLPAASDGGAPAMAVTAFRPDPARPDIQVAVVAVDLARAQLHMVAGTLEPQTNVLTPTVPLVRDGRIPDADRERLLAAFNGGFKAIHGNDGMGIGDMVFRQPVDGRATLAVLASGEVRVGLWGRDFTAEMGLAAWRQNGQLLVDAGQVTPRALEGGAGWGASVDKQVETWRSGVGVSADGRTLFYAVGDALTSARLAQALAAAGAQSAMQMDINNYWVRFVTYQRGQDGALLAQPLISAMPRERGKYLGAEERDFMYLTAK
ncbi:SH3 domain-containing protein [Chloroflexia bacterium SDU3-3]|nr:SH3 domain-containing protein [Chloroflexia bacterium SDU3-3]